MNTRSLSNQARNASSPYLQIFRDSPIHWQEWNSETLGYAREHNRPLFVSVGTSDAEIPRLMAAEVFSSDAVAEFLNTTFVSLLVDRRQRPDIAHYLTEFSLARAGRITWPVHAFLTPDLRPMYTFSYIGLEPSQGAPDIIEVLWKMRGYFEENNATLPDFPVEGSNYREAPTGRSSLTLDGILSFTKDQFDRANGGFGTAPKYPPFSPLLFLLNIPQLLQDEDVSTIVRSTLDALAAGGLRDVVNYGFYTHCVDDAWREPAPEKTLIDQALHLWIYSLAYQHYKHEPYKNIAIELWRCIESQFQNGSLYISSVGKPHRDENIITAWNAMLACALTVAAQSEINVEFYHEAKRLREEIVNHQAAGGRLARSSFDGTVHPHVFLEDYAAMALLDTLLAGSMHGDATGILADQLEVLSNFFYGEGWIHAIVDDFRPVPAKDYDSPHPSPASLAELALQLIQVKTTGSGAETSLSSPFFQLDPLRFGSPLVSDIRNLTAAIQQGHQSPML